MAMIHPSDENFALTDPFSHSSISGLFLARLALPPTAISSPTSAQGQYHKLYFVSLPRGERHWAGRDVVLRVARKTFTAIKTENEVAMINLMRAAGIPAPEIAFYSSDVASNSLGHEFICMERIPYPSLSETWRALSPTALDYILSQLVDIFIKMFELDIPPLVGGACGSLRAADHGQIELGPVLEETMWQLPDIERYFHSAPFLLTSETASTVNPTGPYTTWVAYISAFISSYVHIISIHANLAHLRPLLPGLRSLIAKLNSNEQEWVLRLKSEKHLKSRIWHRDLHFGNILADNDGTIRGIIDWEFAGAGPSFHKRSSPIANIISYLRFAFPDSPEAQHLIETWPPKFTLLLQEKSPLTAARWAAESDTAVVLGKEGQALSDVREFLRSCVEVGVRGWGNTAAGKGAWKDIVEKRLGELGC